MAYSTEQIAQDLKNAREGKSFSQRELARLAGVPQSHISKIENGTVDLRLSSLVQIARALDLEVTLVPRHSISAVQTIVRSARTGKFTVRAPSATKELDRLSKMLSSLSHAYPTLKEIAQIQRRTRELYRFVLRPSSLKAIEEITKTLRAFERNTGNVRALRDALRQTQELRNALAHSDESAPAFQTVRPAYSLDEDTHG